MGGGTGSVATHVLLLRCCAAPWRCVRHDPPTFPLFLLALRLCVICGGEAHEREIRWRGFNPHHLSREDKNNTKPLQPQGALVGAIGHFGTKNAPEVKRRILLTFISFLESGCCAPVLGGTPLGQCCWKDASQNISPETFGCRNLARKWKRDGGFTLGNCLVSYFEPFTLALVLDCGDFCP